MPEHPRTPIFILDSEEKYRPIAVESVEQVPATLIRADDQTRPTVREGS
ncbi:MAG TPA: hypothetical protein VFX35_07425 [Solirubrobacterales bacterium]|nr:hypothetical protein [Solirubrobacterales bacterium]